MSETPWFEQLEARLEQQLEAFLRANPAQEALLEEQEQRERQQQLKRQRRQLQGQAEQLRSELLGLASSINQWQTRVERARAAGASALAERAGSHLQQLMAQGRDRWQTLAELGQAFARVEEQLQQLASSRRRSQAEGRTPNTAPRGTQSQRGGRQGGQQPLEQAWAAFEAEQALEELRRRTGR